MLRYLTIAKFATESGYSEKAIRHKMYDGTWEEGKVWRRAEDGRILIDVRGYEEWVEMGQGSRLLPGAASRFPSPTAAWNAGSESGSSPLPLT